MAPRPFEKFYGHHGRKNGHMACTYGRPPGYVYRYQLIPDQTRSSAGCSFALIDIIYTAKKTISPVYLIDAIIQLSFIFIYSVLPIFRHVFKVEKN